MVSPMMLWAIAGMSNSPFAVEPNSYMTLVIHELAIYIREKAGEVYMAKT